MDQIYPDQGLVFLMFNGLQIGTAGWLWDLFSVNVTPALTNIATDFNPLPTWGGYASINVPSGAYTLFGTSGHTGFAIAGLITFGNTSGVDQAAYGYIARDSTGATLLLAARFDGAPLVVPSGIGLNVLPNIGDYSGLSS